MCSNVPNGSVIRNRRASRDFGRAVDVCRDSKSKDVYLKRYVNTESLVFSIGCLFFSLNNSIYFDTVTFKKDEL